MGEGTQYRERHKELCELYHHPLMNDWELIWELWEPRLPHL